MGKPRIITKSYTQFGVESYEGQSIEDRCKKLVETGEPIKDTSPIIYTPKEKGVMPQYDVRADKWEIAQNAGYRTFIPYPLITQNHNRTNRRDTTRDSRPRSTNRDSK